MLSWQVVTLILGLAAIAASLVGGYWHYQVRQAELADNRRRDDNIAAAAARIRDEDPDKGRVW